MKKIALPFLLLALARPAAAETVKLKDGRELHGKISQTTDAAVYVDNGKDVIVVSKSKIQSIDYSDVKPEADAAPETTAVSAAEPAQVKQPINDPEKYRFLLFAAGDIYGPGGMSDVFEQETADAVNEAHANGQAASGETTTTPGIGARAGILLPEPNGFEVAASLGLVGGPTIKQTLNYFGTTEVTTRTSYFRALLEGAKTIPIGKTVFIRIAAGAGAAVAAVRQEVTLSGAVATFFSNSNTTEHWSGFTYEISPSILFPLGSAQVEAGLRYSYFPTKDASDNINEIKWHPLSVFAGFRFGL